MPVAGKLVWAVVGISDTIVTAGTTVRLAAQFWSNSTGTPTVIDPTTVVLKTIDAAGTQTTQATVKDSVGNYHFDLATLSTGPFGKYRYTWYGSGNFAWAEDGEFFVQQPLVT